MDATVLGVRRREEEEEEDAMSVPSDVESLWDQVEPPNEDKYIPTVQEAIDTFRAQFSPKNIRRHFNIKGYGVYEAFTSELCRKYGYIEKLEEYRDDQLGRHLPEFDETMPSFHNNWLKITGLLTILYKFEESYGNIEDHIDDYHVDLTDAIHELVTTIHYNHSCLPQIEGFKFIEGGERNLPYLSKEDFATECDKLSGMDLEWQSVKRILVVNPETGETETVPPLDLYGKSLNSTSHDLVVVS